MPDEVYSTSSESELDSELPHQNGRPIPRGPPRLGPRPKLESFRKEVDQGFRSFVQLISNMRRPVTDQTGDGTELRQQEDDALSKLRDHFKDVSCLGVSDVETLLEVHAKSMMGEPLDDKLYLMENLIVAAQTLPEGSENRKRITNQFLTQLWNDLDHPPKCYLGNDFEFRTADGSNNSLLNPRLGAANTPYARTVKPETLQAGALPDPGVLFDTLMCRKTKEKHPNRISSVLFYLASIIIHDLFRTDHKDFSNSQTSSYLDLSPLYGSVWEDQRLMRTFKDGKLKPDCFSEKRLLLLPPGVGALLIMFNRFHNYVVEQLALINEGDKFKPKDDSNESKKKCDELLFQTGRLITCGLYVNIILIDYVRVILNLNRTDSNWQLDPRVDIKEGIPMGLGNQVSAEFNLVYRWHATISDKDEERAKKQWEDLFGDRDPKDVDEREFLAKLQQIDEKIPEDPFKRDFGGIKRGKDGSYENEDLVMIMVEAIEDSANAFGARRVPAVMRAIEILGIKQARSWNLATLNEFRKHFGLEPHRTFEHINPDPEIAKALKHLYDRPDLVELYPGIAIESTKIPMIPGAGLTPNFTISRAVLSDAVSLVRGDRFYTTDYHPRKLTNWGYSEVEPDLEIDNGCMFYKLFARAFPQSFESNSVYAHYPMTIPSAMKIALQDLGKGDIYNYTRPEARHAHKMVLSYAAAEKILGDKENFKVVWGNAIEFLMGKHAKDFMLSGDGHENEASRKMMEKALFVPEWEKELREYYERTVPKILKQKAYKLGDLNQVDIIRDVGNIVHVHFASELFMLPLKTKEQRGIFTEYELYTILTAVFVCVFFDLDPGSSFMVRQKSRKATKILGKIIELNVWSISFLGKISDMLKGVWPEDTTLKSYGIHLIQRLLANGMGIKKLVWGHIMGTVGGMVPNQGQLFAQTMDYYMTEGYHHVPAIHELALRDDDDAFDKLMHYFLEGSRLYGETGVFRRAERDTTIDDGHGRTVHLRAGEQVMVNFRAASHDPEAFPNPHEVDLERPLERYIHLGSGPHKCLGLPMIRITLTALFKHVMRLKNLRPAAGPQGRVQKVMKPFPHGEDFDDPREAMHYHAYLIVTHGRFFPFPCSMKVNWDDDDDEEGRVNKYDK